MKKRKETENCMKNQKGFTLVELLVGMAILSIVVAAITGFIVSGSKSYAAANTEIMVQQEAQLAMNQISDIVIDTTRSVNYTGYTADGSAQQVVKDADFTIDVEDKSLTLFNGTGTVVLDAGGNPVFDADGNPEIAKDADGKPIIDGGNGNQFNYQFYYDKSEEKLYYSQIALSDDVFPQTEADGMVVLAEYVKDFSVDLSQVEEKRVVQLTVSYEYNNRIYDTSNNITIRNKVLVNSVNLAVDRSVELSIRPKENMVVLEPGEHYYKFSTPRVEGRNITDKSVTWSISAEEQSKLTGADTGFTDTANGIIHISSDETANSFKVTITTNAVDSSGNHATAEVVVYVKRVKSVTLTKTADTGTDNGPTQISPGCTFTISANAEGNKLGVTCSNCGDNTDIDRYVVDGYWPKLYAWRIWKHEYDGLPNPNSWDPEQYVHVISSDEHSATFYVEPDTPDDGSIGITIQATSLLSVQGNAYGRNYAPVFGAIELVVKKSKGDLILVGGGLKYGSRELYLKWDYIPHTAYICARIKEGNANAPASDDKIMIYKTDGKAILIAPDVFGLDLNKDYYLSIQVLAADMIKNDKGEDVEALTEEQVVADYLNNSANGIYTGSIKSSSVLDAILPKPQLTIEYNGKEYTGEEININPIYFLHDSELSIPCNIKRVSSAKGDGGEIINNVKANLYLDNNGGSQELYVNGVSLTGSNERGLLKYNTDSGKIVLKMGKIDRNNYKNVNEIKNAREAIGNYHYTPYFTYSNEEVAKAFHVCKSTYEPNYSPQVCIRPESNINFSITDNGNASMWAYTNNGEFKEGKVLLPLPSDSSFRKYFALNNSALQSVVPSDIFVMNDSDGNIHVIEFSKMTCEYIPTEDSYVIELFYECYDSLWNCKVEKSAGRFKCSAKGNEWGQIAIGNLDEQLKRGNTTVAGNGNVYINITDSNSGLQPGTYEAMIPLPDSEIFTQTWWGGFGFNLDNIKNNAGTWVEAGDADGASISYKQIKDGTMSIQQIACADGKDKAKCMYDIDKKAYILEIYYKNPNGGSNVMLGKFICKEGGTFWEQVKEP